MSPVINVSPPVTSNNFKTLNQSHNENHLDHLYSYYNSINPCTHSGYYPKKLNMTNICPHLYKNTSDINCGKITVSCKFNSSRPCCSVLFQVNSLHLKYNKSYIVYVQVSDKLTLRKSTSFQVINIIKGQPPPVE